MKKGRSYSITEVASILKMEESKIRFFESKFREFLDVPHHSIQRNVYLEDHIKTLSRIQNFYETKKLPVNRIKRELSQGQGSRSVAFMTPGRGTRKGRVITVASGKGGVGKTTFSVNMAVELAALGYKVGIFDGDLGLSNVHIFTGVNPPYNLGHVIKSMRRFSEIVVEGPKGIKIVSGGSGIFELANVDAGQRERLIRDLCHFESQVDYLIIDTGAGISENVLSFLTLADEAFIVTTRDIAAITDAYSIIKILVQKTAQADIHLIVNRVLDLEYAKSVYQKINSCSERFLKYTLKSFDYIIEDMSCFQSAQKRVPLSMGYPKSYALECVRQIVNKVKLRGLQAQKKGQRSFFGRLLEPPVEMWHKAVDGGLR